MTTDYTPMWQELGLDRAGYPAGQPPDLFFDPRDQHTVDGNGAVIIEYNYDGSLFSPYRGSGYKSWLFFDMQGFH